LLVRAWIWFTSTAAVARAVQVALVDRAGGALGDHQRPDRLDLDVPAPGRSRCAARQGCPGGADRVQRIGLALAAAVLPVRAVHLDDPDPGGGDVPGQPGAVTAGALNPDQADGAEAMQSAQ
jgi:hypothetical protein